MKIEYKKIGVEQKIQNRTFDHDVYSVEITTYREKYQNFVFFTVLKGEIIESVFVISFTFIF